MGAKFIYLLQALVRSGVDYRNSASLIIAVRNIDKLPSSVVSEIIDIVSKIDRSNEFKGIAVVYAELASVAAHKKLVGCSVNHPLRSGHADAVNDPSGRKVDDLLAVIAQSGDEETALVIDPQMVDASLHVGKRHSARED
jgi:hypothetical protein